MEFKFKLGVKVVDWVTGFTGIITSRTEYLNGCIQYGIKSKMDKDGKIPDTEWLDESQLTKDTEHHEESALDNIDPGNRPGGPQDKPPGIEHP